VAACWLLVDRRMVMKGPREKEEAIKVAQSLPSVQALLYLLLAFAQWLEIACQLCWWSSYHLPSLVGSQKS